MEPVRHLCDGARDCGCIVVSRITQSLHPTHPQNHSSTKPQNYIYNLHTNKITHLQPTHPQNHTYTNHKIISTTYTPTKSHNSYNPPTHKITHLQSTHLQNHITSTTHKIISTNYTPTKSHSVYNPHSHKTTQHLQSTKLINNLHTSRITNVYNPHTHKTTLLTTKRLRTPVTG